MGHLFNKKKAKKNILIVSPNSSDMLLEIQAGLATTLVSYQDQFSANFGFIEAHNNFEHGAVKFEQKLLSSSYDIIYTLGKKCTEFVKNITTRKRIFTPVVFGGVLNPVNTHLIKSEHYSGNHLTGISAIQRNYLNQMKLLLSLKPDIKKIILIYNPATTDRFDLDDIKNIIILLRSRFIDAREVIINNEFEIERKLQPHLEGTDIITIFRDYTSMMWVDVLLKICNNHRIPLYTSDFETVKRGAAIGISDFDYNIGIETARKSLPILIDNKEPRMIPISQMPWKDKIMINADAALQQNLSINVSAPNLDYRVIII